MINRIKHKAGFNRYHVHQAHVFIMPRPLAGSDLYVGCSSVCVLTCPIGLVIISYDPQDPLQCLVNSPPQSK